jgi:hypothetical protein
VFCYEPRRSASKVLRVGSRSGVQRRVLDANATFVWRPEHLYDVSCWHHNPIELAALKLTALDVTGNYRGNHFDARSELT